MLDKQTLPTEVTPLCQFSLSTPQSVSAGIVVKMKAMVHAGQFCVTVHYVGVCLHAETQSTKQRMPFLNVWLGKDDFVSMSGDQVSLYSWRKILWNHRPELILFWSQECFNRSSVASALPGRLLSLCPTSAQTHSKISHVHRVDHKHRAGLGPFREVTQSSAVCLNSSAAAVTRQADATHAPSGDEVSAENRARGEATNNIFTEKRQGAEIVSIGSVLLFAHCVLRSPSIKRVMRVEAQVAGTKPLKPRETCLIA